jgi:hypothetical protein
MIEEGFKIEKHEMPSSEEEFSMVKDLRDHLNIKSDTIEALLNTFKGTIFQKEKTPFTLRGLRLRELIIEIYAINSPSIFPWSYSYEPGFEKETEDI